MDIEDLFNETEVEETKTPLVIPEFGPCSTDGPLSEESKTNGGCC
jgi:hypothetical protein